MSDRRKKTDNVIYRGQKQPPHAKMPAISQPKSEQQQPTPTNSDSKSR